MGIGNSTPKKLSNDDILANINKLFRHSSKCDDNKYTFGTLEMNGITGGSIVPPKKRYVTYENRLNRDLNDRGRLNFLLGVVKKNNQTGGNLPALTEFENEQEQYQIGGCSQCDSNTSPLYPDQLKNAFSLSTTSQNGGCVHCGDTTSQMNMSQLENVSQLSATSQNGGCAQCGNSMIHKGQLSSLSATSYTIQNGGCGCNKQNEEQLREELPKPNYKLSFSLSSKDDSPKQSGGSNQTSEEINIMPFYSSTSGMEYYSNMQKEHRYT